MGTARLVVDGTDTTLVRKATISLSPGRVMDRRLTQLVRFSREVYNAALQHRRDAWRMERVSVTRFDQFTEIPGLFAVRPDLERYGTQFIRGAMSRVDEAFGAFFRRVKAKDTPGYPRFKSARRFSTVFYDEPVSWSLRHFDGTGTPCLYVQGVGEIPLSVRGARQLRRLLARGGEPRTLTITRISTGAWRASVCLRNVAAKPLPATAEVGGVDRGIAVTAALPDGTLLASPRFSRLARDEIIALQRERALHEKGSVEWGRCNKAVAKAYRSARQRSDNWAREAAKEIVGRYGVIALEDLKLPQMTRSARGTKEQPGINVASKRGLNRSLQEAALGRLANWVCAKAEEAGRRVYKVDPRNSSRECAACGHTTKENRPTRASFSCTRCNHQAHADVNAAQVLSARGQAADARWREAGCPLLTRPKPRLVRRRGDVAARVADVGTAVQQYGAGSAPHATARMA
ncbi:MAG: RNA-guided endonuclease InsQ/TnpB family protein [Acidimicrobiales bacterium]